VRLAAVPRVSQMSGQTFFRQGLVKSSLQARKHLLPASPSGLGIRLLVAWQLGLEEERVAFHRHHLAHQKSLGMKAQE